MTTEVAEGIKRNAVFFGTAFVLIIFQIIRVASPEILTPLVPPYLHIPLKDWVWIAVLAGVFAFLWRKYRWVIAWIWLVAMLLIYYPK